MCAVLGALLYDSRGPRRRKAETILREMLHWSHERGRDGRGFAQISDELQTSYGHKDVRLGEHEFDHSLLVGPSEHSVWIGNLRAEPTTEYVKDKKLDDQQPYSLEGWHIVHNGTIANDKELRSGPRSKYKLDTRIDSATIVEQLARFSFAPNTKIKGGDLRESFVAFEQVVRKLKGSFAILAMHESEPDHIMVAANYRPIWYCITDVGAFFASARDYLPGGWPRMMIEPYTVTSFMFNESALVHCTLPLWERAEPRRALVVCSGGLDSVVAATVAQRRLGFDEIELLHFRYGSRAEGPEVRAVKDIAQALGVELHILPMNIYDPTASPLLRSDSTIAGGEAGAEFAHEWVPARNLVMLSLATAYAEAKGFDTVILGNNLEEAGAYPDNEPEFIAKFNDLLPFAVGDGKRVRVEMPVGNLMKHEIVALGLEVGAPLDKTWSCYRAGSHHCGTCGPCFMRRTAFRINSAPEVISYLNDGESA